MADPSRAATVAEAAEADGWDGLMFADNQNLWGDHYVALTLAATATSHLLLGGSATNAGTRHPAVTAAAVAAVDRVAGGRVTLGIARGDSALAHVGSAPVSVPMFAAYLSVVRDLLHGRPVPFDRLERWRPGPSSATLPLRDTPPDSRLHWLDAAEPPGRPVPITVYVSGPRMIEVAVRHADRVFFGFGADVERLAWGISVARECCERIGRDPGELAFGAGMSVGVADELPRARALVSNMVASSARFSSMHGRPTGPVRAEHRGIYEGIATGYDMNHHGRQAAHVATLTPEFIDTFAVVGPVPRCAERLLEIHALGIDHILIAPPRNDVDPTAGPRAERTLIDEVLPAVRRGATRPTTPARPSAHPVH